MGKAWYKYTIKYFDCLDERIKTVSGLCRGGSFHSAVKKIERHYGDDLEEILNLVWVDDSSVLAVDEIKENFEIN